MLWSSAFRKSVLINLRLINRKQAFLISFFNSLIRVINEE